MTFATANAARLARNDIRRDRSMGGTEQASSDGCIQGPTAIALENYFALCRALGVDDAKFFAEAARVKEFASQTPVSAPSPLSAQELPQGRIQVDAMPVEEAANDRSRASRQR